MRLPVGNWRAIFGMKGSLLVSIRYVDYSGDAGFSVFRLTGRTTSPEYSFSL